MKKLATLEVWLAEPAETHDEFGDELPDSSGYSPQLDRIVLRPDIDAKRAEEYGIAPDITSGLLHELGHFVSHLTHSPTSQLGMLAPILGEDARRPEEMNAWRLAEKMGLPIDLEQRNAALSTYGVTLDTYDAFVQKHKTSKS